MFTNHTKGFWKRISALLLQKTGRVYSWQSCRRQVTKWESQQSDAQGISSETAAPPGLRFEVTSPPRPHNRIVLPPISHLNLGTPWPERELVEDSSDDEMLPALNLPPVRTRSHQPSTVETCRSTLNSPIFTAMHDLEMQLQVLTSTLAEQNINALAVENAFQNLKHEILNLSGKHDKAFQTKNKRRLGPTAEG